MKKKVETKRKTNIIHKNSTKKSAHLPIDCGMEASIQLAVVGGTANTGISGVDVDGGVNLHSGDSQSAPALSLAPMSEAVANAIQQSS